MMKTYYFSEMISYLVQTLDYLDHYQSIKSLLVLVYYNPFLCVRISFGQFRIFM